ncbi:MAG: helix-turn-helix transcriptional regulator, partial [Clostridiales bacterium]|nr:helix-turn-helix transcriptional regulator [Clostridiales bacterium]
ARKHVFATGDFRKEYSKTKVFNETVLEEVKLIDQIVQLVGTDKIEEVNKFLLKVLSKTKKGQIKPDDFIQIMNMLVGKICNNYKNVLEFENEKIENLKKIYDFDNANTYYEAIYEWIRKINEKLLIEYDDYKNKQKIQKAVGYIQENYAKNLNMAVVSNHVSMNYSLFSCVFKQFTGMNFVNYIKEIRMKEAKRLLEETDKRIIEISNLIGYENEKHFMRIFKNTTGVSPTEFRKNAQVGKQNILY